MLTYRLFRNERKKKLKLIHMGIMLSAFILTVIGLKAVFDSHNLAATPIPNLYSLHSWVGIITVALFACQWIAGFVTFLFPGLASHLRASYMPLHTSFGIMIFVLACATALMGITEKLIFTLKYKLSDTSQIYLPGYQNNCSLVRVVRADLIWASRQARL